MQRAVVFLLLPLLVSGCAALAPIAPLLGNVQGGSPPPLQVHEETKVELAKDDFVLVRTNVWGQSKGFSLLGLITIYPATLVKAMDRLYTAAEMRPGRPQTIAHLVIEQSSSYYILFGIPKVQVRADIVEFKPEASNRVNSQRRRPRQP